ncbi:expressed unknown protein [Seminavis robusta]|uniref:Uncharacterized protein n=1 Tax=Seminavis robusta TaxID=568900 RepID=A0A9N8H9P2_9STRA|nr:expressed unknown protein [Seminavis robusta]|eukprot:Sro262_g102040.1 n/a (361) ;mRNA; f:55035-56117
MVSPRKRRAKAKSAPVEEKEDVPFEPDDDEEEEDDFIPGQDDDDDDVGDEEEEDDVAGILEGHLYYDDKDETLHYQGDSFHLSTRLNNNKDEIWNPLCDPPPSSNMATYQMKGTIQPPGHSNSSSKDETPSKLPLRIFDVTWTIQHDGAPLPGHEKKNCPGKTCFSEDDDSDDDDEEEEDGKKQKATPHKRPALFYGVVGREVASTAENVLITFQGGFYPLPTSQKGKKEEEEEEKPAAADKTNSVPLNCQFQYVLADTTTAATTTTTAAASPAAAAKAPPAAAAAAKAPDDEDDDDEADEAMGYDELIALHEDAGMNVEDLKRRYQQKNKNNDDDDEPSNKKFKAAPKDDDDDDDDVGF